MIKKFFLLVVAILMGGMTAVKAKINYVPLYIVDTTPDVTEPRHVPAGPLFIIQDGYKLTLPEIDDNLTFKILKDNECVYEEEYQRRQLDVTLPTTLVGDYEVRLCADTYYYYGNICLELQDEQDVCKPMLVEGRSWKMMMVTQTWEEDRFYEEANVVDMCEAFATTYFTYTVTDEAVVEGKPCYSISLSSFNTVKVEPERFSEVVEIPNPAEVFYMYEEGGKVYSYTPNYSEGWQLAFDNNLQSGEGLSDYTIVEIDTIDVKGNQYRRFRLKDGSCWIEGIGSSRYGMLRGINTDVSREISFNKLKTVAVYDGDLCIFEADDFGADETIHQTDGQETSPYINTDEATYRILSKTDKTVELYTVRYNGESLTIPQTVTQEGVDYTVTSIVDRLDYDNCDALKTLTLPSTLKRIGNYSFVWCSNLTAVILPENLEEVGEYAFCYSPIEQLYIPASVRSIGKCAFDGNSLKSITVAAENLVFDSREDCNAVIETATNTLVFGCIGSRIPASVTALGTAAFAGCKNMVRVELPENLTVIGDQAFQSCEGLEGIELPHSLISIGSKAFSECHNIRELQIPQSVEHIGEQSLPPSVDMLLSVESGNPSYDSREDCNAVIETHTGRLIKGTNNSHIPSSIKSIGIAAFQSCTGLEKVNLPEGLTVIESMAFEGCKNLSQVSIPQSLITIGSGAFGYTAITEIDLPDGLDCIDNYAFSSCRQLERVRIPKNLTQLGDGVFSGCSSLKEVNLPTQLTKVGSSMFSFCSSLIRMDIPAGVKEIAYQAFYQCSALQSVNFPDGLETIGGSAFKLCNSLNQVILPNTVSSISSNAFDWCSSLNKVSLGSQLEKLGWEVFRGSKIKEITLPATLRECGHYILSECKDLESITILATTPPRIESDWAVMVPRVKFDTATLYVPKGSGNAYRSAVEWKNFQNIVEKEMATEHQQNGIVPLSSHSVVRSAVSDLQGRRLTQKPQKGIYILNGRKRVVK